MDKERQIDEIVKIICPVYKDGAKCTFNERQFGERKCADPCTVRTTAKMLIEGGLRLEVHGEWNKTRKGMKCTRCGCLSSLFDKNLKSIYCPWCGAIMDGGVDNG